MPTARRFSQPSTIVRGSLVTDLGIDRAVRLLQSPNAQLSMVLIPSGSASVFSLVQPRNAANPMVFTLLGMANPPSLFPGQQISVVFALLYSTPSTLQ